MKKIKTIILILLFTLSSKYYNIYAFNSKNISKNFLSNKIKESFEDKEIILEIIQFLNRGELNKIMIPIMHIESHGGKFNYGDFDETTSAYRALGPLQIWNVCVKDVNKSFNIKLKHKDMFFKQEYIKVFNLYLCKGIYLYYKKYKKFPSEEMIVRMWNGGIYKGYKNPKTVKYFKKYLLAKKVLILKSKDITKPKTIFMFKGFKNTPLDYITNKEFNKTEKEILYNVNFSQDEKLLICLEEFSFPKPHKSLKTYMSVFHRFRGLYISL